MIRFASLVVLWVALVVLVAPKDNKVSVDIQDMSPVHEWIEENDKQSIRCFYLGDGPRCEMVENTVT